MRKRRITQWAFVAMLVLCFTMPMTLPAQNVLFEENFGVPSANTLIQDYTGWQNQSVTYIGNGTCDVRTSSASSGYGGASGGGNVMINDTVKWLQISGISTQVQDTEQQNDAGINLYCGLRKTVKENGSGFIVHYSVDSVDWIQIMMTDTLSTGTGTSGWYRVCFPNLPASENLHLRFSNSSMSEYRLDDIRIVIGEEVVLDTSALVALPFDISDNSETEKLEIKMLPGFKSYKLGTSYSDGAAKFESKNAGSASLVAHLDSSPDSLFFDLKGRKSGSPLSYNGILIVVSESDDGLDWTDVASYTEDEIGTEYYSHLGGVKLSNSTRYVRWKLQESSVGNTQLNNIKITKLHSEPEDEVGIKGRHLDNKCVIYPNPARTSFFIDVDDEVSRVEMYDIYGKLVRVWTAVATGEKYDVSDMVGGCYCVKVSSGKYQKVMKLLVINNS